MFIIQKIALLATRTVCSCKRKMHFFSFLSLPEQFQELKTPSINTRSFLKDVTAAIKVSRGYTLETPLFEVSYRKQKAAESFFIPPTVPLGLGNTSNRQSFTILILMPH